MAKRKKTRRQKMLADLRRKTVLPEVLPQTVAPIGTYTITAPAMQANEQTNRTSTQFANTNPYLIHDMKKTGILTLSLLALQLILFLFLKHHFVSIPGISY